MLKRAQTLINFSCEQNYLVEFASLQAKDGDPENDLFHRLSESFE